MTEDFVHYIWKYRLFDNTGLKTTDRKAVEVIKPGEPNRDAGPDFTNARIKIGDTIWAGNVEIHINSSDWNHHGHSTDSAYNNIILHVVYNSDGKIKTSAGDFIPTVELKELVDKNLYDRYNRLISNTTWIPCDKQIRSVDKMVIHPWLDRLLFERLERKTTNILETLEFNTNNWAETFYQHLAGNFGFKTNSESFRILARTLPLTHLAKQKDNITQVEAMLFGQANLLNEEYKDEYPDRLKKEYLFLQKKFDLKQISPGALQWKFLRLRPFNFPTIRISQFANVIHKTSNLFSKIIESKNSKEIIELFDVTTTPYWENHFMFDQPSKRMNKPLGKGAIANIIINTAVPFIFIYGKQKQINRLCENAIAILSSLPGEENEIIDKWKLRNMPVKTAYFTQALLQLKNEYCDKKKCLTCHIGNRIIRNSR